jgi:hypothetical protein
MEPETAEATADVDRLISYGSLAAPDRGESYRMFWECLAKKKGLGCRSDWKALMAKAGTSGRFLQNSWFDTPWLV